MQFSQKLSAVMRAMGISNKALAAAIQVDPSLVSRWRSGERAPGKNSDIIVNISKFFSQSAAMQHQKIALLSLMNLPLDAIDEHKAPLNGHLYHWFSEEDTNRLNTVTIAESFLQHAAGIRSQNPSGRHIHYQELPQGSIQSAEVFYGDTGMRNATFKQLSLSLATDKPQIITMFSDQSLQWLDNNQDYTETWNHLMQQCLCKGDRIQVVHDVRRDSTQLFNCIKRWLPFYMTGRVKSYYCPQHFSTIHCHTVNVIEGLAALSSFCYPGTEYEAEVRLYTNSRAVTSMERMLNNILQNSLPLINVFTAENYQQLAKLHFNFSQSNSDNISMINMLTTFSSPESLFRKIISRLDLPVADKDITCKQFRLKQDIFHQNLRKNKYTEIISLPEPEELRYGDLRYNLGVFLGHNDAYYRGIEEFKEHVANVIHLLKTYENYHCFLQKSNPFKNIQIQARENVGVLFTKESEMLFSFILSQPTITQVFYSYLENMANAFLKQKQSRKHTIDRLEQYLRL